MDCPHIPSIEYGEFSRRLHSRSLDSRIPVDGSFEITSLCNLKCVHCYIQGTGSTNELTYPEICRILDQIAEEGCLWLLLTGGEPLVRPDFMDIYSYAKKKGIFITLFTNGTLVTPEIADFLAELPPFAVEISLYGMTPETYEKVTGVPGSFERCKRGIELLQERNLFLRLKSMVLTTNKHELRDMKRYAESIGAPFRFDCMVNARLDGSLDPVKYRLSPEEIVALDFIDDKQSQSWHDFYNRYHTVPDSDFLFNCGAGVNSFHISPTGRLGICSVMNEPDYDLRQGSFHDGFYNAFPAVRARRYTKDTECRTCDMKGICLQCPAWGQLEHGDPEAKVDFLCQVTRLRVAAIQEARRVRAAPRF
jgi:radical SAM protein with 4Fe4S-binding SPASM domain